MATVEEARAAVKTHWFGCECCSEGSHVCDVYEQLMTDAMLAVLDESWARFGDAKRPGYLDLHARIQALKKE